MSRSADVAFGVLASNMGLLHPSRFQAAVSGAQAAKMPLGAFLVSAGAMDATTFQQINQALQFYARRCRSCTKVTYLDPRSSLEGMQPCEHCGDAWLEQMRPAAERQQAFPQTRKFNKRDVRLENVQLVPGQHPQRPPPQPLPPQPPPNQRPRFPSGEIPVQRLTPPQPPPQRPRPVSGAFPVQRLDPPQRPARPPSGPYQVQSLPGTPSAPTPQADAAFPIASGMSNDQLWDSFESDGTTAAAAPPVMPTATPPPIRPTPAPARVKPVPRPAAKAPPPATPSMRPPPVKPVQPPQVKPAQPPQAKPAPAAAATPDLFAALDIDALPSPAPAVPLPDISRPLDLTPKPTPESKRASGRLLRPSKKHKKLTPTPEPVAVPDEEEEVDLDSLSAEESVGGSGFVSFKKSGVFGVETIEADAGPADPLLAAAEAAAAADDPVLLDEPPPDLEAIAAGIAVGAPSGPRRSVVGNRLKWITGLAVVAGLMAGVWFLLPARYSWYLDGESARQAAELQGKPIVQYVTDPAYAQGAEPFRVGVLADPSVMALMGNFVWYKEVVNVQERADLRNNPPPHVYILGPDGRVILKRKQANSLTPADFVALLQQAEGG